MFSMTHRTQNMCKKISYPILNAASFFLYHAPCKESLAQLVVMAAILGMLLTTISINIGEMPDSRRPKKKRWA